MNGQLIPFIPPAYGSRRYPSKIFCYSVLTAAVARQGKVLRPIAAHELLRSDIDLVPLLKKVVLQPIVRDLQLRLSDLPLSRSVRLAPSVPGPFPKLD
jgi:hypothetical protein